jgi:hypothetical protein
MLNRKVKIALISAPLICLSLAALVPVAWMVCYFGYLAYSGLMNRGHQEFAVNGLDQIEPAAQMDQTFDDCRHYIVYSGPDSVSTWNSSAYFGGRYALTMQVPVKIKSATSGKVIGEPRFYLNEVRSVAVHPNGVVSTSFARDLKFGPTRWKKVFEANGDFAVIGFQVKTGPPVKNFAAFARASR